MSPMISKDQKIYTVDPLYICSKTFWQLTEFAVMKNAYLEQKSNFVQIKMTL